VQVSLTGFGFDSISLSTGGKLARLSGLPFTYADSTLLDSLGNIRYTNKPFEVMLSDSGSAAYDRLIWITQDLEFGQGGPDKGHTSAFSSLLALTKKATSVLARKNPSVRSRTKPAGRDLLGRKAMQAKHG
jgi:hypothetical protein